MLIPRNFKNFFAVHTVIFQQLCKVCFAKRFSKLSQQINFAEIWRSEIRFHHFSQRSQSVQFNFVEMWRCDFIIIRNVPIVYITSIHQNPIAHLNFGGRSPYFLVRCVETKGVHFPIEEKVPVTTLGNISEIRAKTGRQIRQTKKR